MIEAQVILDSISPQGHRLTTFSTRYPKGIIHGEVMTHRKFSRNASSSRAIPVQRYLEEVHDDKQRAAPEYWGAEQKGMQSGAVLDAAQMDYAKYHWAQAAHHAAVVAQAMSDMGVHKSIVNRLLDPFIHIRTLITSDHYGLLNFFGLRLDKAAQPEMRVLAEKMWAAWNESMPKLLQPDEWHLPYANTEEMVCNLPWDYSADKPLDCTAIKVSVARCARVSYNSFETGKRSTVEEDLKLYERLVGAQPMHASPAEHQATPDDFDFNGFGGQFASQWLHPLQHGNFVGWRQYRKFLQGEGCAPLPDRYDDMDR